MVDENFGVDYVIHYKFPPKEKDYAEAAFPQLIHELTSIGLTAEVRLGRESSVLVFVKAASERYLRSDVYKARLQDWLYGIRPTAPEQDVAKHFENEPVSEAERLRLLYLLITKPKNEGGAGIIPKCGSWKYVESIFPLHNHAFNRAWIKEWSTKYMLDDSDVARVREKFGEKVALYFAFLQAYFKFLIFPASFGFGAWLLLGGFSWIYAIAVSFWTVIFFEYWKQQETDLAVQWGVRGVSKIQLPRPEFHWDREAEDPVTGEVVKVYSPVKRLKTQLLQLPFALACALVLGSLVALANSVEIFISEVYSGPGKAYMVFIPTIILTIGTPTLSTILTSAARKLTDMENYKTKDAHHAALIQKIFFINFVTSYMALFITSFVYLPFGNKIVPYLDFFHLTEKHLGEEGYKINPGRLGKQLFYYTVTAQIVNFATETIIPYAKRRAVDKVKEVQSGKNGHEEASSVDSAEEAAFIKRVCDEAELEEYEVTDDLREMVMQFGYLSLFSVAWPLVGCSFLVNNWVEARSDAMKIAVGSKRPIPWRGDSIGPWLNSLGFLSWLGSLTSAALVYMYGGKTSLTKNMGEPSDLTGWALLLSILLAEHLYLAVQHAVRYALKMMDSPGLQKEKAVRFELRKRILQESYGHDLDAREQGLGIETEKITRITLENEARRMSTKGHGTPGERFWLRQKGADETIEIGRKFIAKSASQ